MTKQAKPRLVRAATGGLSARATVVLVMGVYCASGMCSLMDEVVWARLLKLTLGNTVYASSVVVSVFMGGLALGAILMGRYADRLRNRLRAYAMIEATITVVALLIPGALRLADGAYRWFYLAADPTPGVLLAAQVTISGAILLIPSMLMGTTLPLLARFVTALEGEAGRLVGRLYALNTLGAAMGCYLAGFVLLRWLGVMGTLYAAAGLNLLVALGGLALSRHQAAEPASLAPPAPPKPPGQAGGSSGAGFALLVTAFFVSGLVSIGYEILWMRSVVFLMGGTTYVFAGVLTVYLLGNVLGAGLGSLVARRLRNPGMVFGLSLAVLGLTGPVYLPWLAAWAGWHPGMDASAHGTLAAMTQPLVHGLALLAAPTLLMGFAFPIGLQAWARHVHLVGRSTGTAYGANTIGAVLGGLVTGFVLVPLLGVQGGLMVLGLTACCVGAAAAAALAPGRRLLRWLGLVPLGGAAAAAVLLPGGLFRRIVDARVRALNPMLALVAMHEGVNTTISLHRHLGNMSLDMHAAGHSIAGDAYAYRGDQKALGHFGMLLNSKAERVLSVGFGSGETTRCLSLHDPRELDCVEIAPEVVDIALEHFEHINLGDRLGEKVDMIYMDAKNYLHLTDARYDVIVNDSIHPREFADNASLYTLEYFQAARERLTEGGLMVSWVPTYQMPPAVFRSLYATAVEAFPHVSIWYLVTNPAPLVLIVCSETPQRPDPAHIERCLADPDIRESLRPINIESVWHLLSCFVADETQLRALTAGAPVNSDYRPFVEFATQANIPQTEILRRFVLGIRMPSPAGIVRWDALPPQRRDDARRRLERAYRAADSIVQAIAAENILDKFRALSAGLRRFPDEPMLRTNWQQLQRNAATQTDLLLSQGKQDRALTFADALLDIDANCGLGWLIRSRVSGLRKQFSQALVHARRAVERDPDNAAAHADVARLLAMSGRHDQALIACNQALHLDERNIQALLVAARIRMTPGTLFYAPDEAVRLARRACSLRAWRDPRHLLALSRAYALAGKNHEALDVAGKARALAAQLQQAALVALAEKDMRKLAAKVQQ